MRKWCLSFVLLLAACAPVPAATPSPLPARSSEAAPITAPNRRRTLLEEAIGWRCPADFSGQTLTFYNWTTYIAENTLADFETLCNVRVAYSEFDNEDDMLAAVRADPAAYDVVVPSNTSVALLAQENLWLPLDLAQLPNLANISPNLLNPPYDPGNRFSVPYQWGTIGVGYNITRVRARIASWQQVFAFEGRIGWLDDNRALMSVALALLGYDPASENPAAIAAARDFLIANSAHVVRLVDDSEGQNLLADGTLDLVVEYSGDIFQIIADCACQDYLYVIPREGALLWVDNLAIPRGARQPALALAFIDYLLSPWVAADISNFTAYASPNQVAINMGLLNETLLGNTAIYPDAETRANLFFIERSPQAEALYNEAWASVRAAIPEP
ncbi:MAG: spermidine/putrescine ABC transporter substrate-binding protein [Chloroflexi bacterium]|nr:spermidine/putrescine ABC transporter substrate-binding protein [Chloroflexota bacterium]